MVAPVLSARIGFNEPDSIAVIGESRFRPEVIAVQRLTSA